MILTHKHIHEALLTGVAPRTITEIAGVAHEINRAYCRALGDDSQPPWEDAPGWQRISAERGVEFHLLHPEATPERSHESWLDEKRADGWAYGPVKDPEKKEHPCFVPYDQLPLEQRVKDYLFKAVIDALRTHQNAVGA